MSRVDVRGAPANPVEVAQGIWLLRLPMPGRLGHVCAYALEDGDGVVLVDGGWGSEESFAALTAGLRAIGSEINSVHGVYFTHRHRDHFGSARLIRERCGAWLALHRDDARAEARRVTDRSDILASSAASMAEFGMAEDDKAAIIGRLEQSLPARAVTPDRFIEDGESFEVGTLHLVALHTPGHSAGHVCLIARDRGVVFTGDHVLSRTTPYIGSRDSSHSPLDDYMRSLVRVRHLGDLLALPGHEFPVPVGRRADEILSHHEQRLLEARAEVANGAGTVWEIAAGMTWSRPWDEYDPWDTYLGCNEAFAHLLVLERRGLVAVARERVPWRWRTEAGRS